MSTDVTITVPDLDEAIAAAKFTGLATVHVGAKREFARAEGMANRAHGTANTADTRFAIASGAKAFTALAAMRLVEEGVLTLDDPVRPTLGKDLPLIDDAVTLRHLLTHTSGIGDYLDESGDWDPLEYVLKQPVHTLATTEGYVPELDGFPQEETPGETFRYNNGAFVVAALVIERISGRGFHELVDTEVCQRAGLKKTSFLRNDNLPGDAALGYLEHDGNWTNVLHFPVRGNGDGGLYTTADDMAAFWLALGEGKIVSKDNAALMTSPAPTSPKEGSSYGIGFWLSEDGLTRYIVGGDAGVSFVSAHQPDTKVTATVFGNMADVADAVMPVLDPVFASARRGI